MVYILAMVILKTATIEEAEKQLQAGSFVYNNPCSKCGKECSTPTKELWVRRVNKYGSVKAMYEEYVCRGCRPKKQKVVVPKRAQLKISGEEAKSKTSPKSITSTQERRPGDSIRAPKNSFGLSVWDNGRYLGTSWIKHPELKADPT